MTSKSFLREYQRFFKSTKLTLRYDLLTDANEQVFTLKMHVPVLSQASIHA